MKGKFYLLLFVFFVFTGCENGDITQNPNDYPNDVEQDSKYEITSAQYSIGDFYNENGKMGVVFEVYETGNHGKIVNLSEAQPNNQWNDPFCSWALSGSADVLIGAQNENDGSVNLEVVTEITDWEKRFPAFAYCANLGKGWYLPAVKELEQLLRNEAVASAVDYTLFKMNLQRIAAGYYWSSTEINEMEAEIVHTILYYTGNNYSKLKYDSYIVRAVAKF